LVGSLNHPWDRMTDQQMGNLHASEVLRLKSKLRNDNMHFIIRYILGLMLMVLALSACRQTVSNSDTVQFTAKIFVVDTTLITRAINQDSAAIGVKSASVELASVSYGLELADKTDGRGQAWFRSVIPDFYNCFAQKHYPKDTVKKYLDLNQEITLIGSVPVKALNAESDSLQIIVTPVISSDLLISEIYYNGAPPPPPYYFHDQFTEIYNNSLEVKYLDNYAFGDVTYGYREEPEYLHCVHLYKFPGSGTDYPIYPGEIIIVAQDAINHQEFNANSLDLTIADFEYYNHLSSDVPNPNVPNMIQIHHKYGIDFLYSVMNDAIVLFELQPQDTIWNYDSFDQIMVPGERAVDGVEYREELTEYEYKHLPDQIDAGITGGMPMYKRMSIARKVLKEVNGQMVLKDNNNSSIDFKVLDQPTPKYIEFE